MLSPLSHSPGIRRFLATTARQSGEQVTTETISHTRGKNGKVSQTITQVRTAWQQTPLWKKYMGGIYLGGGMSYAGLRSYNDGKTELLAVRRQRHQQTTPAEDWAAVARGCRENSWDHFLGASLWPFTIVRNCMPKLVLLLNPVTTPSQVEE